MPYLINGSGDEMFKVGKVAVPVALVAMVASLAACGTEAEGAEDSTSSSASEGWQPVTVQHAFGETVIEEKPERVATVDFANQEVPLALGIVPVGMSEMTWGDDDGDCSSSGPRTSWRSSAPRRRSSSTRPTATTSRASPARTPT